VTAVNEVRSIDICVCTFRRSHLADTLHSLDNLTISPAVAVSIIVADNDETPSAQGAVEAYRIAGKFPIRYRHAPARNISLARNACLDESRAGFVAFIDDDEIATPVWLSRLLACADETAADAVLGPVRAKYSDAAPVWMRKGDFHSTFPVIRTSGIRTGYTCNVLLRMTSKHIAGRRFDLMRGRSGGEDTAFFDAVTAAGGRIAYAAEAWVEEDVIAERATFAWLATRRFRIGQTHGLLLGRDAAVLRRVCEIALAGSKAGFSFASAAITAFSPIKRNRSILRGIMHSGVVGGLLGQRELDLYGVTPPEQNRIS
jgi:succinoglycan biosynthesis protein ExoM